MRIERAGPLRIGSRDLQQDGRYCALFDVIYDERRSGSLLYIKSAVYPKSENMPIDVLQYAGRSDTFPHESTARQFFAESQFESYRVLGIHTVDSITGEYDGSAGLAGLVALIAAKASASQPAMQTL